MSISEPGTTEDKEITIKEEKRILENLQNGKAKILNELRKELLDRRKLLSRF